jgi:V/A-type H+/Na+-transporting ATPase subunit E
MGLEEMLNTIRSNTEAQYAKTISDAKAQADKILSDATQQAEKILEEREVQARKDLEEEKLRSIAAARLEAKRRLLVTKDEILTKYEDRALGYLKEFAQSPDYKDYLLKLVKDGVSKIGSDAVVEVKASDRQLLQNPKNFQLSSKNLVSIGGAVISSDDGKRRVNNTLESLFEDRKEDLRLKLSEELFGKN